MLVFHDGEVTIKRYWKLSYRDDAHLGSDEEIRERLREQLLEATRLRLRSDVPVGAFLSGGVDSSAVVAAMAQLSSKRVKTFSIGFHSKEYDETRYASEVAQLFDTEHHEFHVDPSALELLPLLVWHYGEPFADPSAIPTFYLSKLTRSEVTVALTGDGGDENFAGYNRYYGNKLAAKLEWLPDNAARAAAAMLRRYGSSARMNSTLSRAGRVLDAIPSPPEDRYAAWVSVFTERERDLLYTPSFKEITAPHESRDVIARPYLESDARHIVERLLDVDVQTYLADQLLVKVDIASMAYSLEVRSPLLDHVFMETAASIPATAKLDGRVSKRIFKDAIRPWIPDDVLDRPKQGFGVPLRDWFRDELAELPREILLDERSTDRGLFNDGVVRRLISTIRRPLRIIRRSCGH